jgi:hypothetical protein
MPWFYTRNGQQLGPVSDNEFARLVTSGIVQPDTLVWREGMAQWMPHRSVNSAAEVRREAAPGQRLCANCSRPFPIGDLLRFEDNYICAECKPAYFQRVFEGLGGNPVAAWRSGKFLITRKGARLPDRCIRCNRAANNRAVVKKLFWQPGWIYAPIMLVPVMLIGLGIASVYKRSLPTWIPTSVVWGSLLMALIFGILSTIVKQRADLRVPLCAAHFRKHYIDVAIVVGIWIVGGGGFIVSMTTFGGPVLMLWFVGGFCLLALVASVYSFFRTRLVTVKRMTDDFIWLSGASPEYLAELPEWDGRA